jgi:hypothetical protein
LKKKKIWILEKLILKLIEKYYIKLKKKEKIFLSLEFIVNLIKIKMRRFMVLQSKFYLPLGIGAYLFVDIY